MKQSLLLILIALTTVCCHINTDKKGLLADIAAQPLTPVLKLKYRKQEIDAFSIHSKNKSLVLAKIAGQNKLIVVKKGHWPDHIECIYNVFKDASNNIVMIFSSPFNNAINMDVNYTHYFDSSGKTFAFEKLVSFSNSTCSGLQYGIAYESNSNYYNGDFKLLSQDYNLTDGHGNKLKKNKCSFEINRADEQIYPNVTDCLKGYHIGEKTAMLGN